MSPSILKTLHDMLHRPGRADYKPLEGLLVQVEVLVVEEDLLLQVAGHLHLFLHLFQSGIILPNAGLHETLKRQLQPGDYPFSGHCCSCIIPAMNQRQTLKKRGRKILSVASSRYRSKILSWS